MAHCSACGSQLGQGAQFCGGCGRPITALAVPDPPRKGHPILWTMLALLLLAAVAGVASVLDSSTPTPQGAAVAATSTDQNKKLPPTDRAFVGASAQYLKFANQSGSTMAEILAGASAGTSTLADCRAALLQALSDESANYSRYRADRGQVPSAFVKVDRQITENHAKTISALKTTLGYWQTGDLSAISRGMDAYKAAVMKANAILTDINKAMEQDAR